MGGAEKRRNTEATEHCSSACWLTWKERENRWRQGNWGTWFSITVPAISRYYGAHAINTKGQAGICWHHNMDICNRLFGHPFVYASILAREPGPPFETHLSTVSAPRLSLCERRRKSVFKDFNCQVVCMSHNASWFGQSGLHTCCCFLRYRNIMKHHEV